MNFLVLYDRRGQCQRVARVSDNQLQAFLDIGFQVVDETEYRRCAELVDTANIADLDNIRVARDLINRIGTNNRPTPPTDTKSLDKLQERQRGKLRNITQSFLDGNLSMQQWFRQMVNAVNTGNIAASALAVGGIDNLNTDDIAGIERANETQLQYIVRFRRELETLSPAMALNRSSLYAGATTSRYWTAHTRRQGLVLPAMPGVRTSCGSNCKCNWDIRQLDGNGNYDCYWRISAVEHCDECIGRQKAFKPLQVRNGIVQPFNPNGLYA